jgi:hypothetical protein
MRKVSTFRIWDISAASGSGFAPVVQVKGTVPGPGEQERVNEAHVALRIGIMRSHTETETQGVVESFITQQYGKGIVNPSQDRDKTGPSSGNPRGDLVVSQKGSSLLDDGWLKNTRWFTS